MSPEEKQAGASSIPEDVNPTLESHAAIMATTKPNPRGPGHMSPCRYYSPLLYEEWLAKLEGALFAWLIDWYGSASTHLDRLYGSHRWNHRQPSDDFTHVHRCVVSTAGARLHDVVGRRKILMGSALSMSICLALVGAGSAGKIEYNNNNGDRDSIHRMHIRIRRYLFPGGIFNYIQIPRIIRHINYIHRTNIEIPKQSRAMQPVYPARSRFQPNANKEDGGVQIHVGRRGVFRSNPPCPETDICFFSPNV
ncbi:hypothetical protein GGR50DRAFT_209088 [Xylaria sp. CBS 124048]|nr:hypothetical protein GGR50DRAFT_209088 [Xylaria sp. CBS 124048]